MATRLTLLCAGATATSRSGGFPAPDEPLDAGGRRAAHRLGLSGPAAARVLSGPACAAIATARALGLEPVVEPLAADRDWGSWRGRTLADIHRDAPDALAGWIADPAGAVPDGESSGSLVDRVATLLDRVAGEGDSVLVVSHAAPIRAAIAHVLGAPPASTMRIDVAPLARLVLSHHGFWRLQELRRAD